MKTNRDFPHPIDSHPSSLGLLADSSIAAQAAIRLYNSSQQGVRYCCDSQELLTTEEALARDEREAAKRARTERTKRSRRTDIAQSTAKRDTVDSWQDSAAVSIDDDDEDELIGDDPALDIDNRVIDIDDDDSDALSLEDDSLAGLEDLELD